MSDLIRTSDAGSETRLVEPNRLVTPFIRSKGTFETPRASQSGRQAGRQAGRQPIEESCHSQPLPSRIQPPLEKVRETIHHAPARPQRLPLGRRLAAWNAEFAFPFVHRPCALQAHCDRPIGNKEMALACGTIEPSLHKLQVCDLLSNFVLVYCCCIMRSSAISWHIIHHVAATRGPFFPTTP